MKTAAMVRIHRSEELLGLWLKYYSRYFDDLIVFACRFDGKEPSEFKELQEKYKFEYIKVEDEIYSMGTHQRVFDKQKKLLVDNAWVLYSDADEFVVADPYQFDGLRHFMDVCRLDQPLCEGFDVIQADDEDKIDYEKSYLAQRKYWVKDNTRSYNKPLLSRIATDWSEGFHYINGTSPEEILEIKDTGLYLIHIKHADSKELDFPKIATGTHDDISILKERAVLIPEKVRQII